MGWAYLQFSLLWQPNRSASWIFTIHPNAPWLWNSDVSGPWNALLYFCTIVLRCFMKADKTSSWKEHPSSCMTFLWSLYHRPSARLSHATLRWLSGSFSTFAHNVGTAQRCTSGTQWPSGPPRLCVRTYANCQVVWLWKRISLICFSRATAVRVMCSRLSGIQISSRLIALTNR